MFSNETPKQKTGGSNNGRSKRSKKAWGARERASMSFILFVVFFGVFFIIILTEVLMIDERGSNRGVVVRHVNTRFSENLPDYEDVKDDYADDSGIFVRENRFSSSGIKSIFKKNSKNMDPTLQEKLSIGIPVAQDSTETRGAASVQWGQVLPNKIEQNLPPYPANTKPTDGSWQLVNGTRYKFFVFSAYYDRRDGRLIRVIGATKTRGPEKVWCRLWYPLNSNRTKFKSVSVMARVKVIRENWNLKYSACFIMCPLRTASLDIPYSVSIVSKLRAPPGNILLLRNTDGDKDFFNRTVNDIPKEIAVCVKPLHFNYDHALYLLEFLELNGLLGVRHFTFYNHTVGPHTSCLLDHYVRGRIPQFFQMTYNQSATRQNDIDNNVKIENVTRPKITVNMLPWNLKMRSQKEIRTEGLFASLNDCLYRSMYRYSHVALIDLDEFIIPRHNETLTDMLDWINGKINNRNTGAYSFQNAFFYLQFADDELMYDQKSSINPALRAALVTQKKTRRRSKLHPQKQRSKYICKPESVIEAGNHFVWEFCPGRGSLNVPAESAILHHYRVCEFGGDDCVKTPSLLDRTAHKYSKMLVDRVGAVYDYLKEPCKLPDLPSVPTKPPVPRKRVLRIKQNQKAKTNNSSTSNTSNIQNDIKVKKIVFRYYHVNNENSFLMEKQNNSRKSIKFLIRLWRILSHGKNVSILILVLRILLILNTLIPNIIIIYNKFYIP